MSNGDFFLKDGDLTFEICPECGYTLRVKRTKSQIRLWCPCGFSASPGFVTSNSYMCDPVRKKEDEAPLSAFGEDFSFCAHCARIYPINCAYEIKCEECGSLDTVNVKLTPDNEFQFNQSFDTKDL